MSDQETINTLRAERDALKERLEIDDDHPDYDGIYCRNVTISEQDKKIDTLRANNAALREACKAIVALDPDEFIPKWRSIADEALSATPADSLREYRNGVLLEAVQCAHNASTRGKTGQEVYKALIDLRERAMKEANNDTD